MIWSRTSRTGDYDNLKINELILSYVGAPKNFDTKFHARYKFWDYSILFSVMQQENYSNILDCSRGRDVTLETLCRIKNINLTQKTTQEIMSLQINPNKSEIVSCLGELDFIINRIDLFKKLCKLTKIDGLLVITSSDEFLSKKLHRPLTPETLIEFSVIAEDQGFVFYADDKINLIDYTDSTNNIHSLVLKRVGR